MKSKAIYLSLATIFLITVLAGAVGCASNGESLRTGKIVKPYRFNLFNWEVGAIASEAYHSLTIHESPNQTDIVIEYIDAAQAGETQTADGTPLSELRPKVEKIIESQIKEVLDEQGIDNPAGNFLGIHFPPVRFVLSKPPDLLVVSPRSNIQIADEARLKPGLSLSQIENIESQVDNQEYSSLVVGLGGMGTFPSFVNQDSSLPDILNDAAHEWMHTYLAFKPLGFRYILELTGIVNDYDIVTINETVAGICGDEVGNLVYNKYYASILGPLPSTTNSPTPSDFDFNAAMRNIRLTVDALLAQGKTAEAEQYMNEQRDFLESKGYYIRKLNQAYFAFYGTYASEPTSVSPIGTKIQEVRAESNSIKSFIAKMSPITSVKALNELK